MPLSGINPKNVTLFSATSLAASTTGNGTDTGWIEHVSRFTSAQLYLKCGTVTGTSPTLNVYIQTLMPDNATWTDLVSFTQITSSNASITASVISAEIAPYATTDATLAAGVKATHMGAKWRVKLVVGGTNPAFANVSLTANLF